ncbi:hypothetical protein ABFS83_01G073200 [Erythranthe nasuta]
MANAAMVSCILVALIFVSVNKMVEGREIVSAGPTSNPSASKYTCATTFGTCGAILGNFRCQHSCANVYGASAVAECGEDEPGAPYGYCECYHDC